MQEAIALARTSLGSAWPNPSVGCLIVRDGVVVGRGVTETGGRPHAEVMALDEAGDQAFEATLYVSLEPCSHWGETPPCTDAIIEAGVKRVVVAALDPDRRVNGNGVRALREAGIKVDFGVCRDEAADVNEGFFHRVATGRPLVSLLDAVDFDTGDLFYGAAFFDAVMMSLPEWLRLDTVPADRVTVVVDDAGVAPAELRRKTVKDRQTAWFMTARDRAPGRLMALRSYLKRVFEVDGEPSGAVDLDELLVALGGAGLTRVAVGRDSALAPRLVDRGLAESSD